MSDVAKSQNELFKKAAVIGSGFGGLALAIRLQSAGIQTTILESRDKPGGRAYFWEKEGFIFDGGPTVTARIANIRAVKDSELYTVAVQDEAPAPDLTRKDGLSLVSNRRFDDYRVSMISTAAIDGTTLHLSTAQARDLQVTAGDSVRAVALRPRRPSDD
jgi:phytoene dehydrogenase-like protein